MDMIVSVYGSGRFDSRGGLDSAFLGVGTTETGHKCWSSGLDKSVAATKSKSHDGSMVV